MAEFLSPPVRVETLTPTELGHETIELMSGAGHDAQEIAAGITVLAHTVLRLTEETRTA